jgi:hypothetical protein
MTDQNKLVFTLVAQNAQYLKKLEQSQSKIQRFEKVSGQSIDSINKGFNSLNGRPVANIQKFGKAANDSAKKTSRAFGQLGFQVQDIAVQLQGGQNPLLILSQQGSQVASIFGPGGAVIGAFVAVGAALAGALLPTIFKTTDAVKTLDIAFSSVDEILKEIEPNIISLTDKFARLAQNSQALSQAKLKTTLQDISEALKESDEQALKLVKSLSPSELGGRFDLIKLNVERLKNSFIEGNVTLQEFGNSLGRLFVRAQAPTKAFKDIVKSISEITEKSRKLKESQSILLGGLGGLSTESQMKELDKKKEILDKVNELESSAQDKRISKLQDTFFAISDSLRSEEEILQDSYNSRLAIIESFNNKFEGFGQEANDARIALEERFNTRMEMLGNQRLIAAAGFMRSNLAIIQQGVDRESSIGKAAFAAQKLLAIPQIITSTQVGASKALELGPIAGPIASALIQGLGAAAVGVVAGQTIASFEGGGFTGNGARAGGVDGKGGKFAVLHPNEKVIDLNRGQSANDGGWNVVVNNFSNSSVSQSVDEDKRVISIMVDQAQNVSSPFRSAMHQTSNVVPQGSVR